MALRLDEGETELSEINVTPFIDVILVLLIVFMVAAPLSTVDVPVNLPGSSAPGGDRPQDPLWLTVTVDRELLIDDTPVAAGALATVLDANQNVGEINFNWNEPGKVLRIDIAQDKARQYGLSSEDVAHVMNSIVTGAAVSQVKDNIYLINIVGRAVGSERGTRGAKGRMSHPQALTRARFRHIGVGIDFLPLLSNPGPAT